VAYIFGAAIMLENELQKILSAESKAEAIIKKGQEKVKEIKLQTETDLEQLRKDFALSEKKESEKILAKAEKEAYEIYNKAIELAKTQANEITRIAKKNEKNAVELVLEKLN